MSLYRYRDRLHAMKWTGDRKALLTWLHSLPLSEACTHGKIIVDFLPDDGVANGSLITWRSDNPKLPHGTNRIYGNQIWLGDWVVLKPRKYYNDSVVMAMGYPEAEFNATFEEE